jgi:20S proteasome alpha/beta subunit
MSPLNPPLSPAPSRSYLGYVDLYGTSFSENYAASGYGNYLALPLIRDR